jgi:hypothetical protein
MLPAFGFDPSWVAWILSLTSTTFFSILINDIPSRPFTPARGIRQGDPLSPFLFIILVEGLGHSIQAAVANRTLKGMPMDGINSPISHSQFLDETLMMGSPTIQEALTILSIINTFCEASGMDINKDNSHIFFFNTLLSIQLQISDILGFT